MSDPMDMSLDEVCEVYKEQKVRNNPQHCIESHSTSRGRSTARKRSTNYNGNDCMGGQFRMAFDRARGRAHDEWGNNWSGNGWSRNWNDKNSHRSYNGNGHNKRRSRGESRLSFGSIDSTVPLNAKRVKTLEERQDARDIGNLPKHLIPLSRDLAHFLRHCAGTDEFPGLSPQGWMSVRILRTMRFRTLHQVSDEDVRTVVAESFSKQKPRFQLRMNEGELEIRALHNHSLKVNVVVSNPASGSNSDENSNNGNRAILTPAQVRMPPPAFPPPRFMQPHGTRMTSSADRADDTWPVRTKEELNNYQNKSLMVPSRENSLTAQSIASSAQSTVSTSASASTVSYTGEATTIPATSTPVVDLELEDSAGALPPPPVPGTRMLVVAAFNGTDDEGGTYPWKCLKLKENDIVEFLEMDDRWAKGRHGREEGWYPTVFAHAIPLRSRGPTALPSG